MLPLVGTEPIFKPVSFGIAQQAVDGCRQAGNWQRNRPGEVVEHAGLSGRLLHPAALETNKTQGSKVDTCRHLEEWHITLDLMSALDLQELV